ncbi:MAG: septum formation protein Maf [Xanthomonadales bacterium]|nr:septum formation protein Maf [Xanthomonadales bacterium]
MHVILASSSVSRKAQLQQLGVLFDCISPVIDETAKIDETAVELASRLAREKCMAVAERHHDSLVIGADQTCVFAGEVFGKPGSFEQAVEQLQTFSGNCIEFFTAVCVKSPDGPCYQHNDLTSVYFRKLELQEIIRYLQADQPYDCAGGFKVESMGLSLFTAIESRDPSALLGLPLIKLCEFLREIGVQIP